MHWPRTLENMCLHCILWHKHQDTYIDRSWNPHETNQVALNIAWRMSLCSATTASALVPTFVLITAPLHAKKCGKRNVLYQQNDYGNQTNASFVVTKCKWGMTPTASDSSSKDIIMILLATSSSSPRQTMGDEWSHHIGLRRTRPCNYTLSSHKQRSQWECKTLGHRLKLLDH